VRRFTRIQEDAEDIVQQSFHPEAFVHLHKFEGKSSFSDWLRVSPSTESPYVATQRSRTGARYQSTIWVEVGNLTRARDADSARRPRVPLFRRRAKSNSIRSYG